MNKNKVVIVALICISLTAILVLSIPSLVDYYITHNYKVFPDKIAPLIPRPNENYLLKGKYNNSYLDIPYTSIKLDRQFNNSWLYKECNHIKGDEVKYYGVFYRYTSDKGLYNQSNNVIIFALKREIC